MADEREIGYVTGALPSWGTFGADVQEDNPELVWPKSIDVFDRMRREDAQVESVLRAVTFPIRKAKWQIDPAGARPEVVELVAADLGLPIKGSTAPAPLRTRDRFSWKEHLRLALLELVFGHSVFEQVYRIEGNRARLRKLAWRPPRTISDWEIASDGGLVGVKQHGTADRSAIRIPIDRLVVYVNDREGANWTGRSVLRNAYKNWLLKDRELRAQALTIDRNGLGVPVYEGAPPPQTASFEQAQEWRASESKSGLKVAKDFRAGEAAGASIPNGAKLTLKGVEGDLPDTDKPIRYHDEQIARAVLAHFLNLGTETGSWALGSTFANFFTDSLNAVAEHIADVTQQHVVEDLVDINWGEGERAPRLVAEPIGAEHPATAEAIKALIESKALTVDDALEAHLRAQYGLPIKSDSAADSTDAAGARAAAEAIQKVYLGVGTVITRAEARDIVRRSGAELGPDDDPTSQEAS